MKKNNIDWYQVRIQATIAAMQGHLASRIYTNAHVVAKESLRTADVLVRILKEELEAEQEEKEELFYNNNFTVFDFVGHNKEQVELLLGNEFEIKEKDGRFFVVRKQKIVEES